ncbi:hypothetical protein T265_05452 [Opisthorchis viverrini]|uniref:Uncharacterized protein n=1 Tax=Opisthorchis viverrini TaxID=6198 RepID=A0A074ZNW2_OPIVI|nr:hypothetical protein T265_05452 [Opisthorchis viverrini]KER27487.1 hypothetical protein T265_05452 [Opisthorchis viverrini]
MKSACDVRRLPSHVRITERGPVLKLYCPVGLRPFEVDPTGVVIPSRGRFARYMCIDGQYQRIHLNGTDKNVFLCADQQSNSCPGLKTLSTNVSVQIHQGIARLDFIFNRTFVILYCVHGVWHNLHGLELPVGYLVETHNSSFNQSSLRNPITSGHCSLHSSPKESTDAPDNPLGVASNASRKNSHLERSFFKKTSRPATSPCVCCTTEEIVPHNLSESELSVENTNRTVRFCSLTVQWILMGLLSALSLLSFVAFLLVYKRHASLIQRVQFGVLRELQKHEPRIVV